MSLVVELGEFVLVVDGDAGWGRTDLADRNKPSRLQEAQLPVNRFDTEGGIWDKNFICAGNDESRVAPGDSRGPLFDTKHAARRSRTGL